MNCVSVTGNVVADLDKVRETNNGNKVVDLRLAIRGRKKDDTTFVDVVLWNKTAEIAKEYISKGSFVEIEGRLQQDTWEDKETGAKRSKIRIVANHLGFGPKVDKSDSGSSNNTTDDSGASDEEDLF